MRVIAGTARSLPLKTIEGTDTRPTQDRIKETLFNILQSEIPGCHFLDLYSGSGAIGIEALSRGEDIKFDPQNLDIFKENKQRAVIDNTEIMGNENNLYFEFGGSSSVARVSKYEVSDVGEEIEFVFVPHRMHFFDKVTEDAITL